MTLISKQKVKFLCFLFINLLILFIGNINATNYYVNAVTANNSNSGFCIGKALKKLQKAADKTVAGDTVFVMNETYAKDNTEGFDVVAESGLSTSENRIEWMNFSGHNPVISFDCWRDFNIQDSYIEVKGLIVRESNSNNTPDQALNQPQSRATEYFVSSVSGNDSNSGTSRTAPWKTIEKVESKRFQPGDIVNFERGSNWSKSAWEYVFLISDNGTVESPIIFRAYGTGEMPTFSNGGQVWNKGIKISSDYIIIEELRVSNTGYGGFELEKGADHNIIRKCEVNNCGIGILCYGSNNLFTENYIHDLKMIVDNEIPDTQNGGGDFGCVAFWLYGPKNEISYNKTFNTRGHSYDYKYDGGFLEFYNNCDSTYAHHNWVEKGCGIMEASNGHADNVVVSYNVFIEHLGMFAPHYTLKNFRFENNTCITKEGTTWNDMFMNPAAMIIRNNIFVLGGRASEKVATKNNFTHTNNLYYLLDGSGLGSLELSAGEMQGDPLFVDEANNDFRLKTGSPAIDAGKDQGYKTDFEGKKIYKGAAPDMGAFEY